MKRIKISDLRRQPTQRIANVVFYILIGVAAIVFLLFRLVWFDMPYYDNPDYNAPLLTGMLVGFMLMLVVATLALAVWSVWRAARINRGDNRVVNNIPAHRISVGVTAGTVMLMALTCLLSSTTPIMVNGQEYADHFWLRVSGMLIGTSVMMIVAAVVALVCGAINNRR